MLTSVHVALADVCSEIKDLRIEWRQTVASQTKWLAGLVIVVAGLALTVAKLL